MSFLKVVALMVLFLGACVAAKIGQNKLREFVKILAHNLGLLFHFLIDRATKALAYFLEVLEHNDDNYSASSLFGSLLMVAFFMVLSLAEYSILKETLAGLLPSEESIIESSLFGSLTAADLVAIAILVAAIVLGIKIFEWLGWTHLLGDIEIGTNEPRKLGLGIPLLLLFVIVICQTALAYFRTKITAESENFVIEGVNESTNDNSLALTLAGFAIVIPWVTAFAGIGIDRFFRHLKIIGSGLSIAAICVWRWFLVGLQSIIALIMILSQAIFDFLAAIGAVILKLMNWEDEDDSSSMVGNSITSIVISPQTFLEVHNEQILISDGAGNATANSNVVRNELDGATKRKAAIFVLTSLVLGTLIWLLSKRI